MDAAELRRLVRSGETLAVEFKSDRRGKLSDSTIVDVVVCLSNSTDGGELFVGVEDDGAITGARRRHDRESSTDPVRLQAMIANNTVPQVMTGVEVIGIDGLDVIRVHVDPSPTVVGSRDGRYTRRGLGSDGRPACLPFLAHEMLADRIARGEVDIATIAEPSASMGDLDVREIERFRRRASNGGGHGGFFAELGDEEILSALGVAERRGDQVLLRRGALLLFGRPESLQRFVPTYETVFQVLERGEIRKNVIAHDPLFQAADSLYALLREQNREQEVMIGLTRVAIDRIPETIARELIANALVHRDYTVMGPVHVQIRDDELAISNPGGFPRGITVANLLDSSNPRSRALADAFRAAHLVDRAGRGITRVFDSALRTGRPEPDYRATTADRVVVTMELGGGDIELIRFVIDHDERSSRRFEVPDLQLVRALKESPRMTLSELADRIQQTPARTRARLTRMLEDGLVDMRGDGRGRRYTLSAATYRSLSSAAGYVRVLTFDEDQQKQLILSFVDAHGSISRREAADLCGTSPEAARRVLLQLRDARVLRIEGERRGARYVRA